MCACICYVIYTFFSACEKNRRSDKTDCTLWKFFVDKNRSTAIASILRFVSEFLQSISLAIEFLQSILVRRRVIAIEFLQSIIVHRRVFAIEFLQSIIVHRRVFAIEFLQSILVRRRVFACDILLCVEFLQSLIAYTWFQK